MWSGLFRYLFQKTLTICIEKGLAEGKLVFTDATHMKANASQQTEYIKQLERIKSKPFTTVRTKQTPKQDFTSKKGKQKGMYYLSKIGVSI